jgi:L-lactate permease
VLFGFLAARRAPVWCAAALAWVTAAAVAYGVFHMPSGMIGGAAVTGLVYGVVRLGWMLVAALLVYRITLKSGQFAVVKQSLAAVLTHRGMQAVWVAFAFGTLLEGAGGGAAVVITTAVLYGLGFPPVQAAGVALLGSTVSVAFGGMGNPIRALAASAKIGQVAACTGVGRLLVPVALLLPFWIVLMVGNRRDFRKICTVLLAAGGIFGAVLLLAGSLIPAGAVDLLAGVAILAVPQLLRRPGSCPPSLTSTLRAWSAFLLMAVFIVIWSSQPVSKWLDSVSLRYAVPGTHLQVIAAPPIAGNLRPDPRRPASGPDASMGPQH